MNRLVVALVVLWLAIGTAAGQSPTVICYNCPPEWADWVSQLKAIKESTGITVPHDNKNSGQSLSQLVAEKARPVADITYLGVTFGIQARKENVVAPYKPAFWSEIPDGLKDPEGHWFTIHSGTLGLFVNVDALGGSFDDFTPAINYFKELQKNAPIVPKQTSYARVLSGEIPILFDYDFNAYRGKYKDKANVAFVIPSEGTVIVPYVMSLVKNGPNPEGARKGLDHVMSDKGQAVWANAFLRPVRAKAMSKEAQDKFLPAAEYARAKTIDYARMAQSQDAFARRFQQEVR